MTKISAEAISASAPQHMLEKKKKKKTTTCQPAFDFLKTFTRPRAVINRTAQHIRARSRKKKKKKVDGKEWTWGK